MSALHHYELHCDAPGCSATCNLGETTAGVTRRKAAQLGWTYRTMAAASGRQWGRPVDLCPEHAGTDHLEPPEAGEPLPAVCVDEVALPVEALREIRDCLRDRIRWFESRGRPVPAVTRLTMDDVDEAIRFAAGEGEAIERDGRSGHGALAGLAAAAVRHAAACEPMPAWDDEETAAAERALWEAARAYADSLTPAERKRLGR